jgi:hypothetical protein
VYCGASRTISAVMMRSILIFILLGQAVAALCQTPFVREKRDYIWPFGRGPNIESQQVNIWLDFSQTPPQSYLLPGSINLDIANAGICDVNGNLLFYTNGYVVMNGMHELMENGAGLAPGLMTNDWLPYGLPLDQGAIALPMPGADSIFYLIHARREYLLNGPVNGQSSGTFPLYYSVIVFDSLSPDGMVLEKNVVLTEMPVIHGKLTAVRHANGRDWWILVFKYFSNQYHRFLLSAEGIAGLPMDSVGLPIPAGVGQAVFSPDGTKFAKLNLHFGPYVDIYSFDRCTGLLSQPVHFRYTESPVHGGLVFSPNSRYLYVSSDQYIYQYDTWAADIAASRETIVSLAANPTETDFALAQLGPDGKIYVSGYNIRDLHIIHNPNAAGAACEFEKKALSFDYILGRGIPNHPYYGLGPWDGSPCDTLGIDHHPQAAFRHREQSGTVEFWDYSLLFPTQWLWDFGDSSTGSTEQNPVHTYAAPGEYIVCLTVSNANASDTWCDTVRVEVVSSMGEAARERVEVRVFPNPASNSFTIAYSLTQPAEMRLYDIHGKMKVSRILPAIQAGREEIPVQQLSSGIYVVFVLTESGERFSTRLSIMR